MIPQQGMYQEDQQDQPGIPVQQPFIAGHTTEGALQYQLESIDEAKAFLHAVNGEEEFYDPTKKKYVWKQTQQPMVNAKGLGLIKGYITSVLGNVKTYALTELEEGYIGEEVISVGENLKDDLEDNWTYYGVKDPGSASFIVRQLPCVVNAVLRKALNANYLKFLRTTQNIQEVQHHQALSQTVIPQKDDRNVLKAIFGKRR